MSSVPWDSAGKKCWVGVPSSGECLRPRDRTQVSTLQVDSFTSELPEKLKISGEGSLCYAASPFRPRIEVGSSALQADSSELSY